MRLTRGGAGKSRPDVPFRTATPGAPSPHDIDRRRRTPVRIEFFYSGQSGSARTGDVVRARGPLQFRYVGLVQNQMTHFSELEILLSLRTHFTI